VRKVRKGRREGRREGTPLCRNEATRQTSSLGEKVEREEEEEEEKEEEGGKA
jgi:hypothetical protein